MIEIEKDVPIPEKRRGREMKYDFAAMEVGHSFFAVGDSKTQVSILTCARRHRPKKFITKREEVDGEQGYRCWRTK